ncbi:MAG: hypothetical protein A3I11_06375 [Elusimicrobia bacterium RIFCSPLOWO2_02_FULL_39_32]|nr:MAG: hypothetical protein A2034_07040 [Elusimicrobia bacterium GWA2_38_7]OGR81193.1 MAG: hypothetical protein A3B80_08985 [Elusimicrobia bacterium RIFCSPHIGHO2_02_FULL_39_36]OGR91746.1 MAG: hypothetical protein A3I11_06375 [Elusimicrobia bacterium RIFCSPLOWO2_02_FULL_39_32]OGR98405.1 MAG: hypothetical protein A3G85_02235 [Elusimicrobia bacterium RIFCSPLOWO2_12_FULL_39_28]
MPQFEFDSQKSKRNKAVHGIDFLETQKLWASAHVLVRAKFVQGENRSAIIGEIGHKFYVAIFTERRDIVRIISCHRADRRWVRHYEQKI